MDKSLNHDFEGRNEKDRVSWFGVNNFNRFSGLGAVSSCLVSGPRVIMASG